MRDMMGFRQAAEETPLLFLPASSASAGVPPLRILAAGFGVDRRDP